jgi:peroxiredoxin Q/BCP
VIPLGHKIDVAFRLKTVSPDGVVREAAFAELLTRPTIVSVYMKNKTPSCDRQNDALRTVAAELDRAGFNLIALSRDTPGSHARYGAGKKISYLLASDPEDRFARAVGAIVKKQMYGRTFFGPARAAYLFETDGTLLGRVEKVEPAMHADQLRALVGK